MGKSAIGAGRAAVAFSSIIAKPFDLANTVIRSNLSAASPLIYEAGGGSSTALSPAIRDGARIVVVDTSQEQLDRCDYAHDKICASIEDWHSREKFDLISCINVLEHVEGVEDSLRNFAKSVNKGGIIFVASPRKQSLQGMITRFTPHSFHVWYYRKIRGNRNAGEPGYAPFPVFFSRGIARKELLEFLEANGMEVLSYLEYEGTHARMLKEKNVPLFYAYKAVMRVAELATLGIWKPHHSDFWVIARKAR